MLHLLWFHSDTQIWDAPSTKDSGVNVPFTKDSSELIIQISPYKQSHRYCHIRKNMKHSSRMNKPNQAKQLPLTGFPRRSHWRWSIRITVITLQYFIPDNRLKHRIKRSYSISFVLFQISKYVRLWHRSSTGEKQESSTYVLWRL